MVVWALGAARALRFGARLSFVEEWMVLLLFPPVAIGATSLQRAPLVILSDESTRLPVGAGFSRIVENVRLSSEVLPIVRVDTLGLVVLLIEGTPLSLEVEHPEVCVTFHGVNHSRAQALCRVGKGAVVAVLTLGDVLGVPRAVLGLVLFGMVDGLNAVVAQWALVALRTVLAVLIVTQIGCVEGLHHLLQLLQVADLLQFASIGHDRVVEDAALVLYGVEVAT